MKIFLIVYLIMGTILEAVDIYFHDSEEPFGLFEILLSLMVTLTWPYWWIKTIKEVMEEIDDENH